MNKLSEEVRSAAAKHGNGKLTHEVIANLPLMDSVIYETLRMQPPIAVQVRFRESESGFFSVVCPIMVCLLPLSSYFF